MIRNGAKIGQGIAAAGALLAWALLLATPGARAQTTTDPRWQGWIGCWSEVASPGHLFDTTTPGRLVCVVPASASSGVDVATVDSGRVVSREHIDATGKREPAEEGGCKGWRTASWSPDGHRLYLRADYTCAGGVTHASAGLFSFASGGDWLDVRSISNGATKGVRVVRYRPARVPAALADQLGGALAGDSLAARTARIAAGAPLTTADVVDASHHTDAAAVEGWLLARHDDFRVDASQLEQLAAAHVPDRVIDAVVALSYPKKFAIGSERDIAQRGDTTAPADEGVTQSLILAPYGVYPYDWSYYSPYGYYSPFGYGFGYGGWYPGGPVVIIRPPSTPTEHGQVVNGRGYTRSHGSSGAEPSGEFGGSSGGSSAGASGRTSSGSGASTGRTAKPRP